MTPIERIQAAADAHRAAVSASAAAAIAAIQRAVEESCPPEEPAHVDLLQGLDVEWMSALLSELFEDTKR